MAIGQVTYTLSAFKRAGFVGRGGQLVLESGHETPQALNALAAAIAESNEAMAELEAQELWGQVNSPVPTPQGPMALVTECEPGKALTMVLDHIKGGLERRGISGKVRPAKTVQHRGFENNSYRSLGAMLTLPVDEELLLGNYDLRERAPWPPRWLVGPTQTRVVVEPLLDWVLDVEGPVYVWIGATQIELEPDAVVDFVCSTLPVDYVVAVRRIPDDSRLREVYFSEYGGVTVQSFDPAQPRGHHLAQLTGLLEQVAPNIDAGFVREASTGTPDRQILESYPPQLPLMKTIGRSFWVLAHLEHDYVYDAFVTQVLTSSQLAKTRHLPAERWTITPLGQDRHLVQHTRPELWFDTSPPRFEQGDAQRQAVPQDVLDQAREDFGGAIMTTETLEEHPPPLPIEEQIRALGLLRLTPR